MMTMLEPAISQDFLNYMESGSSRAWGVHDCYGRAFYMNTHTRRVFGLPEKYDISGRHFSDLPAPIFFACSDKVIEQNNLYGLAGIQLVRQRRG
ncbi:hypothetical protein GZ77_01480 [Endozoicomonas montiporae]|uniref:Uncharacterized protein n=3 Tax=Endozoicomonas montiporae TaxID=1027273 RepID=A0A081NA79_9GAMM|nr:hypothetical protein [Endozoicomonas montiporae]AMO56966.1 hypothetical protein EZMO1_2926 [Endozoicomonas montiporae CL-33]KEQ15352.1 hypothetical protein GZ77_01480 [Endozoicomonas montiporae]